MELTHIWPTNDYCSKRVEDYGRSNVSDANVLLLFKHSSSNVAGRIARV
jgi:hypothetical protein